MPHNPHFAIWPNLIHLGWFSKLLGASLIQILLQNIFSQRTKHQSLSQLPCKRKRKVIKCNYRFNIKSSFSPWEVCLVNIVSLKYAKRASLLFFLRFSWGKRCNCSPFSRYNRFWILYELTKINDNLIRDSSFKVWGKYFEYRPGIAWKIIGKSRLSWA